MAGTSLNDIVTAYAAANAAEATYNAGKALLQATYTEAQIMAAGSGTYNEGLKALADTPTAPTVTTTTLNAMTDTVAFSQQLAATGNPVPTWSVTAGTIVSGLSLSSSGLLSGTPDTAGAYDFTVTATNSEGSDIQQYTGTVAVAPVPPTISTTTLDAMTVDSAFSQVLAATGDATITWAVTAGTIPAGLSLSSGGTLSGTPTTDGAYDFTVTATNDAGTDTQQYTGTVAAASTTANYFTGGTVTVASGYRYHTFNSSGTLTFVDADGLGTAVDVDYLVVAGGGGGGAQNTSNGAGGGGAGGMLTASAYALGATQTVTVGAGGAGAGADLTDGTAGSGSSLGAISTTVGGGPGKGTTTAVAPGTGGSGGGAPGTTPLLPGLGTAGQGNIGGNGDSTVGDRSGGGGGGKGAVGSAATANTGGAGGAGAEWPSGSGTFYAGGGGGASTTGGAGGSGGGGAGGSNSAGSNATANTGGGGGGGEQNPGGVGGSGVVIVRYLDDPSMPRAEFGSTVQSTSSVTVGNTYTLSANSIGTADTDRRVVAAVHMRAAGATPATSSAVTIGGVSATLIGRSTATNANSNTVELWLATVPTGTTATVVPTVAGATSLRCSVSTFSLYNTAATANNVATSSTDNPSLSPTATLGGVVIAAMTVTGTAGIPSIAWTGVNEHYETNIGTTATIAGGGSAQATSAGAFAVTATATGGSPATGEYASIAAAW